MNQERPPYQQLEGIVERLTFQSQMTGYTVAHFSPKGSQAPITIVGAMAAVNVGQSLRLLGQWKTHPDFGVQFEVVRYAVVLPAMIESLRAYLSSGLVKGIGEKTAAKIIEHFGLETLNIFEQDIKRLAEVPGIGAAKVKIIAQAWDAQQNIKQIMLFLRKHKINPHLAIRIYRKYGEEALGMLQNDPYQLVQDIFGIDFQTADKVAQELGIPFDAPQRVRAGLLFAASYSTEEGHVFATREESVALAAEWLGVDPDRCEWHLDALVSEELLVADEESQGIYLPTLYYAEGGVASRIRQLLSTPWDRLAFYRNANWEAVFKWLNEHQSIQLSERQQEVIQLALTKRVVILTGGPGTGKSMVTGTIIRLLRAKQKSVLLAAPTGRAARRLSEATKEPAQTIHRLLEWSPSDGGKFLRHREHPLDADMIIIDEASMIDTLLMNDLLKAVEPGTHLLLVGDIDQLPSVGAGSVLRDLIGSELVPTVTLDQIYRQKADSFIISNAHRINKGYMPIISRDAYDFFLFPEEDPQQVVNLIIDIVTNRLPRSFGWDTEQDIQVLSPMHRGEVGVVALNEALQQALNPPNDYKIEYALDHRLFREGDRVMQTVNNYDKDVFNGDMGRLLALDLGQKSAILEFDGEELEYELHELDQLTHAYTISVHKSQGAEYPVVVMPLFNQHYLMLQRNLLYTAVTRATNIVVLVGSRDAIRQAVENDHVAQRNTSLAVRLRGGEYLDTY